MDPNHFNQPFAFNHHQQFYNNNPQQTALTGDNMHNNLTGNYGGLHRTPAPPFRPPSTTMEVAGNNTARFPPQLSNNTNKQRNSFYKTGLCNKFQQYGTCPYGDTCTFAHGFAELRKANPNPNPNPNRNPNSGLCYSFMRSGSCRNGNTCPYSHQRPQPDFAPRVPFNPQPSLMMNHAQPPASGGPVVVPMGIQNTGESTMNINPNPSTEIKNSSNPSRKIKNGVKPSRLFKPGKKIASIYADWTH
ncbi:CCCH zinc finger domain-containing protein [Dioscorea alata]|uniref:CCCH zinc finger domain-containing protein n=1 Tax=Dioscorea alata TaxID=55571 RepID=A0ACB7U2E9_DIOAL|nr:CCCH zinc finger domain-containing protein [Dioscorea alata]